MSARIRAVTSVFLLLCAAACASHALEGDLANLARFFDAGIRMMSPSHFFDTDIGGSAHGVVKDGLTDLGRRLIGRMEAKGMLVDVAHASARTIDDVLAIATRPLVVSPTGVRGARTGGVIGIGCWSTAVCGRDVRAISAAIRYTTRVVGVEHVALGSDFDIRKVMGENVSSLLRRLLPAR
jgi:microsomal dipeptidase-like Zn-dependent dipeptidase